MAVFKKVSRDTSLEAGRLAGNAASLNMQAATNAAAEGMELFAQKAASPMIQNGTFASGKGSLFEYIEAAKFNTQAAKSGLGAKAIVTDAVGDSQAAADILIKENGRTVKEIQAKFIKTRAADGHDTSAAMSVMDQTGAKNKGWGQYDGMDRLIRKQENYNGNGSLLDEAKRLSKSRAGAGGIHADTYADVHEHLTDEINYKEVSSGGTTIEEVSEAYENPAAYAQRVQKKHMAAEMRCSAVNMAKACFVTTGICSGITNMFEVFKDEKNLADALHDIGADAVEGAAKGGATGAISTVIRYQGLKVGSALLTDSLASTVMAGGVVDGGVALYSYARGEIDETQLRDALIDTTAKAATTIYFTKAVTAIMGKSVSPLFPLAVYTTASYVLTATRAIIKNACLTAAEYDRVASLYLETVRQVDLYREQLSTHLIKCELTQRTRIEQLISNFNYNITTGENYDEAVNAIVAFADQAGFLLQHADFSDFANAMKTRQIFSLE